MLIPLDPDSRRSMTRFNGSTSHVMGLHVYIWANIYYCIPFLFLPPSKHSLVHVISAVGGCGLQPSTTLTPSKHLKLSHLHSELPSNSERNQCPFQSVSIYKYVTLSVVGGSFLLFHTTELKIHQTNVGGTYLLKSPLIRCRLSVKSMNILWMQH